MSKELKASVKTLSDAIYNSIEIDKVNGNGKVTTDVYDENIPADLTPEIVKKVKEYDTDFVPAFNHAFSKKAIETMQDNDFRASSVTVPMGYKDSLTVNIVGHAKPFDSEGEELFGKINSVLSVKAGSNGPQMKIVYNIATEMAEAAFKKLETES